MVSELDSLHKILNDKTRRKIVLLLNEKGSLSYTDLKSSLEITNNGLLNFHLKALVDLVTKNEKGQYILTERGKFASKLLSEFTEEDNTFHARKKGWKRLFVVVLALNMTSFSLLLSLTFLGYIDVVEMISGIFGFCASTVCLFFFFKLILPETKNQAQTGQVRTIQDIFVSARQIIEVKEEIQRWVNEEGIAIEVEREGFIRGRIGVPSGRGFSLPKYFEVSFKLHQNGVLVHTEGWISVFDVSHRSFSKTVLAYAGVPRKKAGISWKLSGND